jgi:hypothetical protein
MLQMSDETMFRGDTFRRDLSIVSCTSSVPPVPVDITAWLFRWSVKKSIGDPDAKVVYQGTIANGGVLVTDAVNGKLTIVMPADRTATLPDTQKTLVWDVQAEDPAGNVATVVEGTIAVTLDVTRTVP